MIPSDVEFVDGLVKDAEEEITLLREDRAKLLVALKELEKFAFACHEDLAYRGVHTREVPPQVAIARALIARIEGRS